MYDFILSPPLVLLILVLLGLGFSFYMATFAAQGKLLEHKLESYACGQRNVTHNVSPDYRQFFPYAYFFTIMHVLVLVVATAPADAVVLPLLYVAVGVVALVIIFRG